MKIKIKLSIMVIAIVTVVAVSISVLLLLEASKISKDLSLWGLDIISKNQATYLKGQEDGYLQTAYAVANIMKDYEKIPLTERRDRFDDMLSSTLSSNPDFHLTWSVWKPNALDNMDSSYIGRTGSTSTGQYAMTYIRDSGKITAQTSDDIEKNMYHLNGPNARQARVDNPIPRRIDGKDTYAIIMAVPIINPNSNEVVGCVGYLLIIDVLQTLVENAIKIRKKLP